LATASRFILSSITKNLIDTVNLFYLLIFFGFLTI
jgi:hypothetical protein